jgi:hypothetical protein
LLVIVGAFPVVMHEIRFLSPLLTSLGFLAALTTFTVNCLTTGRHDLYSHAASYSLIWLVAICRAKEGGLG